MKSLLQLFLFIFLQSITSPLFSQNTTEDLKTALVYKIAGNVKWESDTAKQFTIGLLCNEEAMINRFKELARIAQINNKSIKLIVFPNIKSIQQVHLLYVCQTFNETFRYVLDKMAKHNTLLFSEEYAQPGEIMINFKLNKINQLVTFEYNRANILFQGLELNDKIVLLKGTEIEIRQLYLQVRKLWDEQKAEVESLKLQSEVQNRNLKTQKDSVYRMKQHIAENELKLSEQIHLLSQKDSISVVLNRNIASQEKLIKNNRVQLNTFLSQLAAQKGLIAIYKLHVSQQKNVSDSLSKDIQLRTSELAERKKILGEKDNVIQKQWFLVIILGFVILVVIVFIALIYRAFLNNKKAKLKIVEQKEELEAILDKLKEAQLHLVQSEKMASLGVLSSGIAHEINNPLNFINGGIFGLEKYFHTHLEDRYHEVSMYINAINVGIKRATDIVSSLSHYSRRDDLPRTECNIHSIIDNCLIMLQSRLKFKVEIQRKYTEMTYNLIANEGKLHQALLNVLSNAEQAIEKEGIITILTEVKKDKLIVSITDTGEGISPENLEKIFDPFFTTKDPGLGTGLGLSITYKIVMEHNGSLTYESQLGQGTKAIFKFPIIMKQK